MTTTTTMNTTLSSYELNVDKIIIMRTKSKKKEKKKKKKKRKRDDNNDNDDESNSEIDAVIETHKKKKKKRIKDRCHSSDAAAADVAAAATSSSAPVEKAHTAHGATTTDNNITCTDNDCEQKDNKKKKHKIKKEKKKKKIKNKQSSSNKMSKKKKKRKKDKENLDKNDKEIDSSSFPRVISNNNTNQTNGNDKETADRGDNTSLSRHIINNTEKDDVGVLSSSSATAVVVHPSIAPHAAARRLNDLSSNRRRRKKGTAIIVPGTSSEMMNFNNNTSSNNNNKRQKVSSGTGTPFSDTRNYCYGTTNNEQAVLNLTNKDANNDEQRERVRTISVRNRTANIIPEGGLIACHRRSRPKSKYIQVTEIVPEYKAVVEQQGASKKKALTNTTIDDDIAVEDTPKNKKRMLDSTYSERQNQNWEKTFQLLLEYKKANDGSTLVPSEYNANPQLGIWVQNQRRACITEELSKGRIERLDSIGFVWKVIINVPWIEVYQRLLAYKEQFGTTAVPKRYNEDPALGRWVAHQRGHCKKNDRIQLLKDIDFVWHVIRGRKGI